MHSKGPKVLDSQDGGVSRAVGLEEDHRVARDCPSHKQGLSLKGRPVAVACVTGDTATGPPEHGRDHAQLGGGFCEVGSVRHGTRAFTENQFLAMA